MDGWVDRCVNGALGECGCMAMVDECMVSDS